MRWAIALLLVTGCGTGRTEIDLTIALDRLTPAQVQSIRRIDLDVQGDLQPFAQAIPIDHQLDGGEGRLVYLPGISSGTLGVAVDAFDAAGGHVAFNESPPGAPAFIPVGVHSGQASALTLTMVPLQSSPDDGGTDLAVADLAVPDLAGAPDQAVPIDLAGADFVFSQAPGCPDGGLFCESFEEFTSETQLKPSGRWDDTADSTPPQSYVQIDTANGAISTSHSLKLGYVSPTTGGYLAPYALPIMQFHLPLFLRFFARGIGTPNAGQAQVLALQSPMFPSNEIDVLQDSASPQGWFLSTAGSVSYFPSGGPSNAVLGTSFDCWELDIYGTIAELYKSKTLVSWVSYASADGGSPNADMYTFPDGRLTFEYGTTVASGAPAFALELDEILVGSQPGLCP